MGPTDSLVDSYLAAVTQAAADLPAQRRDDLLADLREHIAAARAELAPETEAGVRGILDRLGDPASIAAEARLDEPPIPALPAVGPLPPPRRATTSVWIVVALAVLGVVLVICVGAVLGLAAWSGADSGGSVPAPAPVPAPSSHPG